jgi:hypothetical protein
MSILVALLDGSNYKKPSALGMSFGELCERTRPRRVPRKWTTHKTAVSRAVWGLAERECPLVKVWAQLLVPVYSRKHPRDVNAEWFKIPDFGTWFGGPRPRIKLVSLTAAGANEAICWSPWEKYDFWRHWTGPGTGTH